jgi:hypothetical protein
VVEHVDDVDEVRTQRRWAPLHHGRLPISRIVSRRDRQSPDRAAPTWPCRERNSRTPRTARVDRGSRPPFLLEDESRDSPSQSLRRQRPVRRFRSRLSRPRIRPPAAAPPDTVGGAPICSRARRAAIAARRHL